MDDLELYYPLALCVAGRRLVYRGGDECHGRWWFLYLVSGDVVDRSCSDSGKCDKYGCAVAGTVDVGGGFARGSATRSTACSVRGFRAGRGKRGGGLAE